MINIGTGTLATFATALGLFHKLRTGQGQHVQASLCQTATYQQTPFMLDYEGHVANEPRSYTALGTSALNRFYRAQDRWLFMALPDGDATALRDVEGLAVDGGDLEAVLEQQFAMCPAH